MKSFYGHVFLMIVFLYMYIFVSLCDGREDSALKVTCTWMLLYYFFSLGSFVYCTNKTLYKYVSLRNLFTVDNHRCSSDKL